MAPSLWKSPPALQLRRSRDTLVVLIAALLYAVARYATDRFYGAFDVSSDEVGVTTASLLLSAAVVTAAALAVVVVGAWAVRVLLRASPTRLGLLGAIGFLVGLQGEGFPDWVDGVIGAAFGAVAWFFIEGSSLGRKPIGWRMFTTLSVAIVFGVVAGALSVSNVGVRQLRDGRPNVPSAGPFIIAPLHAPNVRVWSAGDDDLPSGLDDGACATLFGHAGGVTVLHGAGHVWRVPTERLILIADECRALDG